MAQLSMTTASEALKIYYLPGLQYQLNTANPILSIIEKDSESVVGGEIRMALRFGRQGGIGNRDDAGTLPTPNSRQTKQAKWNTKNIFAQIQVSDKTMRASRGQQGAFVALLEADLEDAMSDAKDNLARQVFGDGTGTMATITAAATSATQTVSNPIFFYEGQYVDVYASGFGSTRGTSLQITAVDVSASTITLSSSITTSVNDVIVIAGNYNYELTGFGAVFTANNTLYGLDRTVYKWFNPTVDSVSGEISEVRIQKNIDDVDRLAGAKTNILISSYGVRRAYQNILLATKQIVDVMNLEGGYSALKYNNMPFTVDKYAPSGTLFGLDMSTWKEYRIMDFDWLSEDGAVLSRVPNQPVWSATLAKYCDLGCSKPRGNFKMTGITEH